MQQRFAVCLPCCCCYPAAAQALTDTSPMSEDEITQMCSDPDSFKGRTLELYGRVFNEPEYDDDGVYFQDGETRRTESATRS